MFVCVIILLLLVGVVSGCGLGTIWVVNAHYEICLICLIFKNGYGIDAIIIIIIINGVPYRRVVCVC